TCISTNTQSKQEHNRQTTNPGSLIEFPGESLEKCLQDPAGDDHPMHLVRSVVYARRSGLTVHRFKRGVPGNTESAVYLDRAVNHIVQDLRTEELDHRYFHARVLAAVDLLGSM